MCNLCNGKNHTLIFKEAPTFPTSTETNAIELSIFKNVLYIDLDMYNSTSIHGQIEINFCPFCGKHLTKTVLDKCKFCMVTITSSFQTKPRFLPDYLKLIASI